MLLEQFDSARTAIINPEDCTKKVADFPPVGVTCFSRELLENVLGSFPQEIIACLSSANGKSPVYKINYKGVDIAVFMSPVGAPASTVCFEEVIAMGLKKLIMFGTCGVLDSAIRDLAIILPDCALRDEGTSYHYCKAGDEIGVNEKYLEEFTELLRQRNYSYTQGKTWTTDAPYRETKAKMEKRKGQGAVCVEMECAAMSAVAKFRNVDFFAFFYAADNLDGAKWERRSLSCLENLGQKEKIALLAFELAVKIF